MAGRYPGAEHIEAVWRSLLVAETVRTTDGIAQAASLSETKVRVALKALADAQLVQREQQEFHPASADLDAAAVEALVEDYRARALQDRARLDQLTDYAHSARCRWRMLLEYFGEAPEWSRCGHCDNCLHPPQVLAPVRRKAAPPPEPAASGLEPGQRVTVPQLGDGTISEIKGEAITIAFPDGHQRTFLRSYVTPLANTEQQHVATENTESTESRK